MILTVPVPPNRLNGRLASAHWAVLRRAKQTYWQTLDTIALAHGRPLPGSLAGYAIPRPPQSPFTAATLALTWYLTQPMDRLDNLGARAKWVGDWLVKRKYLADDGPAVLTPGPVTQHRCPRSQQRVVLTLTETAS